jgi:glutamate transport system substrate-binding protein
VRVRRVAGLLALAVGLGGCVAEDDPNVLDVSPADFPPHSTMARLAGAETVTIAVTGAEVDADGSPIGFEPELGRILAGALGIESHQIGWVQTDALNHERLIEDGQADLVIAAVPVRERSLEIIDFAGPYHVGRVVTLSASAGTDAPRLCATVEISYLVDSAASTGTAHDCLDLLRAGEVDVVAAPDLVLAAEATSHLALGDAGLEPVGYGIGLAKGDEELRAFVDDVLETIAADGRWAAAWASTLEPVLGPAEPPSE